MAQQSIPPVSLSNFGAISEDFTSPDEPTTPKTKKEEGKRQHEMQLDSGETIIDSNEIVNTSGSRQAKLVDEDENDEGKQQHASSSQHGGRSTRSTSSPSHRRPSRSTSKRLPANPISIRSIHEVNLMSGDSAVAEQLREVSSKPILIQVIESATPEKERFIEFNSLVTACGFKGKFIKQVTEKWNRSVRTYIRQCESETDIESNAHLFAYYHLQNDSTPPHSYRCLNEDALVSFVQEIGEWCEIEKKRKVLHALAKEKESLREVLFQNPLRDILNIEDVDMTTTETKKSEQKEEKAMQRQGLVQVTFSPKVRVPASRSPKAAAAATISPVQAGPRTPVAPPAATPPSPSNLVPIPQRDCNNQAKAKRKSAPEGKQQEEANKKRRTQSREEGTAEQQQSTTATVAEEPIKQERQPAQPSSQHQQPQRPQRPQQSPQQQQQQEEQHTSSIRELDPPIDPVNHRTPVVPPPAANSDQFQPMLNSVQGLSGDTAPTLMAPAAAAASYQSPQLIRPSPRTFDTPLSYYQVPFGISMSGVTPPSSFPLHLGSSDFDIARYQIMMTSEAQMHATKMQEFSQFIQARITYQLQRQQQQSQTH